MAETTTPADVRLICGMISADEALFAQALERLQHEFGPADIVSDVMDFDFTHYYDGQMGSLLKRQFVSFARPTKPDALAAAKVLTNNIEADFAARLGSPDLPPRPINLDPGYVDQAKLVLASTKDFSHRIYLGSGVFGEITLLYHKGRWDALGWTFPDYASPRYHPFLTQVRSALRKYIEEHRQ